MEEGGRRMRWIGPAARCSGRVDRVRPAGTVQPFLQKKSQFTFSYPDGKTQLFLHDKRWQKMFYIPK
jgi:hypothetical protein